MSAGRYTRKNLEPAEEASQTALGMPTGQKSRSQTGQKGLEEQDRDNYKKDHEEDSGKLNWAQERWNLRAFKS